MLNLLVEPCLSYSCIRLGEKKNNLHSHSDNTANPFQSGFQLVRLILHSASCCSHLIDFVNVQS